MHLHALHCTRITHHHHARMQQSLLYHAVHLFGCLHAPQPRQTCIFATSSRRLWLTLKCTPNRTLTSPPPSLSGRTHRRPPARASHHGEHPGAPRHRARLSPAAHQPGHELLAFSCVPSRHLSRRPATPADRGRRRSRGGRVRGRPTACACAI